MCCIGSHCDIITRQGKQESHYCVSMNAESKTLGNIGLIPWMSLVVLNFKRLVEIVSIITEQSSTRVL